MMLPSRHPILISLPPPIRGSALDSRVLAHLLHRFCFSPRSRASGLQLRQTHEAVVVLVAEVQDAAAVATSLADFVRRADGVKHESATAFIEGDDSGVDILAGSYEAALDSTFPVWLVVADWQPEFDVVADAHVDVRLRLRMLSELRVS
jgi:hypothetical protein